MRCEDVEDLLDEHAEAALTLAQRQDVDAHLATCDDCSTAWLAARALSRHRGLATPAASPTSIARFAAVRQPRVAQTDISLGCGDRRRSRRRNRTRRV